MLGLGIGRTLSYSLSSSLLWSFIGGFRLRLLVLVPRKSGYRLRFLQVLATLNSAEDGYAHHLV